MKEVWKIVREAANDWIIVVALFGIASSVLAHNWTALAWQVIVIVLVLSHNVTNIQDTCMLLLLNFGVTQLKEKVDAHNKICPLAQSAASRAPRPKDPLFN